MGESRTMKDHSPGYSLFCSHQFAQNNKKSSFDDATALTLFTKPASLSIKKHINFSLEREHVQIL